MLSTPVRLFVVMSAVAAVAASAVVTVSVAVYYPHKLSSMYIRGDGCGLNWDNGVVMSFSGSGGTTETTAAWETILNCSNREEYLDVKVLVDDKTWMLGTNHHVDVREIDTASTPTTNYSSSTASTSTSIYPWFYATTGSLEIIENVYSSELENSRDIIVYLPPSYKENTLKVHRNVLIMHDGQNLFDPRTSAFGTAWMCQDALDASIVGGATEEILVVGVYNTPDRNNEYTYIYDPSEGMGGKGDLYLDWIESTLLPLVPKHFRVTIQRDTLGILGSSLGGLISCYAGWTRSEVYGRVGCMSSSFWWDDNDYQNNVLTASHPPTTTTSPALPVVYMDSGDGSKGERDCTRYTQQVYDYQVSSECSCGYSEEQGNTFVYVMPGGTHDEASWGARFHIPLEKLYSATAAAAAATVKSVSTAAATTVATGKATSE